MKYICLTVLMFFITSLSLIAQTKAINEAQFVSIGGIEQWVTVEGADRTRPVILFLHGGPGSTMTPYDDNIYGYWKKDFVLVNWDQRGAGRTFGRNAPENVNEDYWIENPLTVEQMTADGVELSKYLIKRLGKKRIIIIGTSWGSILGARMALSRPDLFYAYIGHAQIVNPAKGFENAYHMVSKMAKDANDQASLDKLESVGVPPYGDAKKDGILLRVVKKYERENSTPAPDSWWKLAPAYDNEKDAKDRYDGDDYSFINFAGHQKMGIRSMAASVDFMKDGLHFRIPVYFIQGEEDIVTTKEATKEYFNKLKAPQKKYFLLPGAAHGHNQSVVDTQYRIVKSLILKNR